MPQGNYQQFRNALVFILRLVLLSLIKPILGIHMIHRFHSWTLFILLFAGCLQISCGPEKGYLGKTRPATETSQIRPNPYWTNISVIVTSVDGMPTDADVEISVLPGKRTLGLALTPISNQRIEMNSGPIAGRDNWFNQQHRVNGEITWDFVPGKEYALAGSWQEGLFSVWVMENSATAQKLKSWQLGTLVP